MVTIKELGSAMKRAMQWLATAAAAAVIASPAVASTITYYHNDLAGSPVAATNSSAQVIWRESYRPYGERLTKSAAAKANDVWFTSRRQDSTGLVYMGARYYDAVTGRFVSTDPKQFDETSLQSFNRYEYANDNPYRYVDPDGKWATVLVRAEYSLVFAVATRVGAATLGSAIGTGLYDWMHNEQADNDAAANGGATSGEKDRPSTLRPGLHAGDSIPARGPDRDFTPGERENINEIGDRTGCHTCGASEPGTKSGNWIPDHQKPSALNPEGEPQRLYPQCLHCSQVQGGQVRGAKQSD